MPSRTLDVVNGGRILAPVGRSRLLDDLRLDEKILRRRQQLGLEVEIVGLGCEAGKSEKKELPDTVSSSLPPSTLRNWRTICPVSIDSIVRGE